MDVCRLVFIGKNWKKKGGDKVLQAYKILKTEGFPCTLTIRCTIPNEPQDVDETKYYRRLMAFRLLPRILAA